MRKPPVIPTEWGNVTEAARRQAALNIRDYPEVKARVEALIGEETARTHYPEGYPGWWERLWRRLRRAF